MDNPHLPKNREFGGKTINQTQHTLACALVYHAQVWYHDHVGIDSVVHQLDAPTLMRLCYDEGAFNAWISDRLENEAVCYKSPLPMLEGTPGRNQAARSTVYTIRGKIPNVRYPLADAIVILFGNLFVTAVDTDHHLAALAPSPLDDVQSCITIDDLTTRALYFAGQIENDGNYIRFTTRVESTLYVLKLLGMHRGYMDDHVIIHFVTKL